MDNEIETIKNKFNKYKAIIKTPNSKINNILSLQIINLLLFILLIYYFQIYKFFLSSNKKAFEKESDNKTMLSKKLKYLKLLTNNNELEYKGIKECLLNDPDKEFCIYHLILPKEVIGKNRILLGSKSDGCYVLLDDFQNIKIAYSFGISVNIQFDQALADKGIDVYMYDHTINSLPYENPKFHWKKIGLCGVGKHYVGMKNIEELIKENGHTNEKNMILKMDIEFWEWEAIINLKESTLIQFKYIAIEYHFKDEKYYKNHNIYYNVLKKISKTHQPFYSRCNGVRSKKINFGNNRICQVIEVSYVIRENNFFKNDEAIYPLYEFDYSLPEIGRSEMNLNLLKVFDE